VGLVRQLVWPGLQLAWLELELVELRLMAIQTETLRSRREKIVSLKIFSFGTRCSFAMLS
jgi:hypothetical protein